MSKKTTTQNHAFHDPLDSFIDREEILSMFRQFLRSAQTGQFQLLAVKGSAGMGKTFLISYLTKRVCPKLKWQTGQISFDQVGVPDFRFILQGLEDALKVCVPRESFKQYQDKRDEYNSIFYQYRAIITIQQSVEANNQFSISGVNQGIQVNAQLHERELQLRSELTRMLMELVQKSEYPLCLFIDGYERLDEADTELASWLLGDVLFGLATAAPQPFQVMTCGREWPSNTAIEPLIRRVVLKDFDREQVRRYLKKLEVFSSLSNQALSEREELIPAFYELTKGHPLVLSLAVAYFKELDSPKRTASGLSANLPPVDEHASIEFLVDRLLSSLPEPHRTLLERGPILRFFDKAALQALLNVKIEDEAPELNKLDDETYEHFLRYPFIKRKSQSDNDFIFHNELRRMRILALRTRYPQIKEQLHRRMADFYNELAKAEREEAFKEISLKRSEDKDSSKGDYTGWLVEIPEKEFKAILEYFYHTLQVKELQGDTFKLWEELTGRAVDRWRRRQAGLLLELVRELVEESEPFLGKTTEPYGQYLIWYSRFLEQEAHWTEAQAVLEQAVEIFEQVGDSSELATCLNNLGTTYQQQGKFEQALSYYERALALSEQVGNPRNIALSFSNLGTIYRQQGKFEQALSYYKRESALNEQVGNPAEVARSLNNLGTIYQQQGKFEQALNYYERALIFREQISNPSDIAQSLNNLGFFYFSQKEFGHALKYFKRALALYEQVGNPADIAEALNNIASIYNAWGRRRQTFEYLERALALSEQVGNPTDVARSFNNLGEFYRQQGELDRALDYYERALVLKERVGNPTDLAFAFSNLGTIYQQQEKFEQALSYYERALALSEQVGNPSTIAVSLSNLGTIYRQQEKFEQALSYYERALALFELVGDTVAIARSLLYIAVIYYNQEKLEQALSYFLHALPLLGQVSNSDSIALSLNYIGIIYSKQEKWEQAIESFEEALSLYEHLGRGFEPHVAQELESLVFCYAQLGDSEKRSEYERRAEQIREERQKNT